MKTKIVTTENELLGAISDIQNEYSKDKYIIKVDTTKWNWEDTQNARWLERHPHSRIKIESIKHGD